MKTAIALFGKRVSPRFDCAEDFMLVTVDNHTIRKRVTAKIREWFSLAKIKKLVELEVDTLICGGIDEKSMAALRFHGISVLHDIKGDVDTALASYLKGNLGCGDTACRKLHPLAEAGNPHNLP